MCHKLIVWSKIAQRISSLQALGLRCTNIPKEASSDLALAIKCNRSLHTLLVVGNNLQSAAVDILNAICNLSSLKVLDLQSNQLSEDASEYLSRIIMD